MEEENGNPLRYFCLEDSMDRGAWQATVQGATESQTEQSNQAHNTVISRSSTLLQTAWCHSFSWLSSIPLRTCRGAHTILTDSSINEHFRCFYIQWTTLYTADASLRQSLFFLLPPPHSPPHPSPFA